MADTTTPANTVESCARGCRIPDAHIPGVHLDRDAVAACPGCLARPARSPLTVCDDCVGRTRAALGGLVQIWPDLVTGSTAGRNLQAGASIHGSDLIQIGDMWRPQVTQIVNDIRDWIEYVARFAEPAGPIRRLHLTELRPSVALAAIRQQLHPLLALHPELDASIVDDVLRYRSRANDALATGFMRRIPLGKPCPRPTYLETVLPDGTTDTEEQACSGELVAVLRPADLGRDSTIQCSRYPRDHDFPQSEWGQLSDQVEQLEQ